MLCSAPLPGIAIAATLLDPRDLTVVAATRLEARVARRELPAVRVLRAGVALAQLPPGKLEGIAISCGLAGGLDPALRTGTVLIPDEVRRPNGTRIVCDPATVAALREGARRLGIVPVSAPLMTSETLVRGDERGEWGLRGYGGADMESGSIVADRLAVVRVVLDTPEHELSEAWLRPLRALLTPSAWRELPWLARTAPGCARLAARVVRSALSLE